MPIDNALDDPNADEDLISPDERRHRRVIDARRQADGELSDSEDEGEGGRRNHARYRDLDTSRRSSGTEGTGTRKFGMGVGIMSSGQASSAHHGAGPSSNTPVARILSAANAGIQPMDLDDTPSTSENGNGGTDGDKAGDGTA